MLVYRDNGRYRLHPCLEINLRHSMGYLALMLQRRHLTPQAEGLFALDYHATPGAALQAHRHLAATHPPRIEDGRIASGYLPLCPRTAAHEIPSLCAGSCSKRVTMPGGLIFSLEIIQPLPHAAASR